MEHTAPNKTLDNGLRLLGLLAATARPHSVTELAERMDLPKSHVHRLLGTLVHRGFATQDADRRYRVGLEPLIVSSALLANHPLRAICRPILHELAQETGLDALVAIPHRGAGLVLATAHSRGQAHDQANRIGNRLTFPNNATGLLFACCLPGFDDASSLPARQRKKIQRERFAVRDPRSAVPTNAMAHAIHQPTEGGGEPAIVGALGLSGPEPFFGQQLKRNQDLLTQAAAQCDAQLALPSAASEQLQWSP